jgi:HlyD family secretion protein
MSGRDPFGSLAPQAAEIEAREPPAAARGTLYALLAFLAIGLLWASLAQVDRVVTAQGRLITRGQPLVVQALETSVVRSVDVRVGQSVKKGERLVTLDPTFAEADASQVRQRVDSLSAEVARLEAEVAGRRYAGSGGSSDELTQADLHEKRMGEYQARLAGYRADLARLQADAAGTRRSLLVLEQRLQSLRQIEAMKADLKDKQFVSQMGLLEARAQRLEAEQAFEDASNKSRQLVEQIAQTQAGLDVFVKGWRQKALDDLVRVRRDRDALREQLTKLERRGTLVYLTAPYDATVLEINKRSVGSVAKEADPILTLVPEGDVLEVELQIAAEDVGFVRKGDPVRIKVDAFPFQKHGTLDAKLSVIGADSIAVDPATAGRGSRAYYPSRAAELTGLLRAVPADTRLTPGMTVTGEVRVGTRSVISYFAYPLIKAFDEGIREP